MMSGTDPVLLDTPRRRCRSTASEGSERLSFPDLITLVVIVLLYANVPAVAVRFYGLPAAIARSIGLLLGIPLLYHLLVRRGRFVLDRTVAWATAFVAAQVVSLLLCDDPERASATVVTSVVEGLALLVLLINVVRTPTMLRRVTWALLMVGSVLGVLSGWQYKFGSMRKTYGGFAQVGISQPLDSSPYEQVEYERRASGPLGEVGRYAQVMLMLVPLGFFRFLGERSWWLRMLGLGMTGLTMVGVMLSFTRGAAIGFIVVLGSMFGMRYVKLGPGMVFVFLGCLPVLFSDTYAERVASLTTFWYSVENQERQDVEDVDTSFQGRDTEVRAAALMYAENPVFGVGPGLYPPHYVQYADQVGGRVRRHERQPHNLYLGLAAEVGTVGVGAFLAMVLGALVRLRRASRACLAWQPEVALLTVAFFFSMVAYLTTGLFLHFAFGRYFWMMLALTVAASQMAAVEGGVPPVNHGNARG